MREKQALSKLKKGKLIRNIEQTIANTAIWNDLRKKTKRFCLAKDIVQVGQWKQYQLMTEILWGKHPKHQTATWPATSTGQCLLFHNPSLEENTQIRNIETIAQDAYHSGAVKLGRRTYWNLQGSMIWVTKILQESFVDYSLTKWLKVWKRKDLLMI